MSVFMVFSQTFSVVSNNHDDRVTVFGAGLEIGDEVREGGVRVCNFAIV